MELRKKKVSAVHRHRSFARTAPLVVLTLILLQFAVAPPVLAAGGDLDPTFGGDGKVIGPARLDAIAIAFQTDGKIVVAGTVSGHFGVARYDVNGTLDPTFGVGGTVATVFRNCPLEYPNAIVVQTDGKIVAVGLSYCKRSKFALARYDTDGTLDPSFGGDGKVLTSFGDPLHCSSYAQAAAIQTDGKVVAVGATQCRTGSTARFGVARYATDGTLDPTFGGDGEVRTDFTPFRDYAHDVAVQADGKIVVAGPAAIGTRRFERFALARYNTEGTLDPSFGGDGKVKTGFKSPRCGAVAEPSGMALEADGKMVVAGTAYCGATAGGLFRPRWALARYDTDGTLDTAFGGDGRVWTIFGRNSCGDAPYGGVAIQTDGKIVAAGTTGCVRLRFTLARYGRRGHLDTTFGGDGRVTTSFASGTDCLEVAEDMSIQTDGKIVAMGPSFCLSPHRSVFARYLPS